MINPVDQLRAILRAANVYVAPADEAKLDEWRTYCHEAVEVSWLDAMLDAALPDNTVTEIIAAPRLTQGLDHIKDPDDWMRPGESTEQYLLRRIAEGDKLQPAATRMVPANPLVANVPCGDLVPAAAFKEGDDQ